MMGVEGERPGRHYIYEIMRKFNESDRIDCQ
jgi:hypothetical protein